MWAAGVCEAWVKPVAAATYTQINNCLHYKHMDKHSHLSEEAREYYDPCFIKGLIIGILEISNGYHLLCTRIIKLTAGH